MIEAKIIFILIFLTSASSFATCKFKKEGSGFHVKRTAKGRVYALPYEVIHEDTFAMMNRIKGIKDSSELKTIMHRYTQSPLMKDTLKRKRRESSRLGYLIRSGNLNWIGFSGEPLDHESTLAEYFATEKLINKRMRKESGWSKQDTDSMLLLMYPSHIIALAKNRKGGV